MSGLFSHQSPTNAPIVYSGLNVGTSQYNLPVALMWGQRRLSPNAIDYDNFQKHTQSAGGKGGGGKGGTSTYSADCLLALCEGPIDSIPRIWASGSTTTTTTLSALGMTLFTGTAGQAPWSYWSSKYPAKAQSYPYTAYLGAINLDLGSSASIPDNAFECVRSAGFAYTHSTPGWINPNTHVQDTAIDVLMSDVITDFLTNPQYGMGWTSGDLGSITQYAAYNRAQGLFFSPLLNSQEKASDILNRWATLTNSWIYWGGTSLVFVPLADDVVTGNGITFTPQNDVAYDLSFADFLAADGKAPVKVTRKDPADCYNITSVNITDRTLGYVSNPFPYQDDPLVDAYGRRNNSSVQADECCDPIVARIIAQLIGKRAAYIRNKYSFKLSQRFILCLPGTVLTLTEPNIGLNKVRVRVTDIAEDAGGNLSFTCEEFPGTAGTYIAAVGTSSVSIPSTPNEYAAPGNINTPAIIEPTASFTGGTAKIIAAASGGAQWGGCDVYLSFDGTTYTNIGRITAPASQGILTASLAAFSGADPDTTNTISVDCSQSFATLPPATHADADNLRTLALIAPQPSLSGGAYIMPANGELLAFGAVAATGTYTDNLTYLQRGQYGTTAAAHGAGEQFTLVDVLGAGGSSLSFDLPAAYIGQTLYLKFASFNLFGLATQDLSTVAEYQYTPTGTGYGTGSGGIPTVPTGLAGVAGAGSAALTWNANPGVDNITTYRLFRALGSGASFGSASLIYQGYSLTYTDATLAGSTAYTYFLEATNAVGTSGATSGVTITTPADGTVTSANFIFNETPSGLANGTNTVFTLSQTPLSGQITISVNGSVQSPSAYTLSGNTITFVTAPPSGATILATYLT